MKLKDAIQKLQAARRLTSPRKAIAYLSDLKIHAQIAILYQHFFPEQYRAAGFGLTDSHDELSKPEMAFFELVSERLFPVEPWSVEEEYINCEPGEFNALAVEPQGYIIAEDEEFDVEIGHFAFPANLLLFLIYINLDEGTDELWDWLARELERSLHGLTLPKPSMIERWQEWAWGKNYIDFDKIGEAFKADPTLKDIQVALRTLAQSTDNIWLDYDPYASGGGECILFEIENFAWYATAWDEAKEMLDKTNRVLNEFSTHPERLVEFIQVWDAATVWEPEKARPKNDRPAN